MSIIYKIVSRIIPTSPYANVRADKIISINELLYNFGEVSEIKIPLIPKETKSDIKEQDIEFAAASVLDRIALAALVRQKKTMRIFEIGTFRGVTSVTMATNAPKDAIVYTLDLPPDLSASEVSQNYYSDNPSSGFARMAKAKATREVGMLLKYYSGDCKINQLFNDSSKMDFSEYYDSIDLFFVDGCHEYEMAKKDTSTAWRCLRVGGVIAWHDYPWKGVQKAIRDSNLGTPITYIKDTNIAFSEKTQRD